MKKTIKLRESELINLLKIKISEQEDFENDSDPRTELINRLQTLISQDLPFDEEIMSEINESKPFRSARGSLYIDLLVPETEDREFDRNVAMKMMEYYSNLINEQNYVGGVGFKTKDILKPYDNDNF